MSNLRLRMENLSSPSSNFNYIGVTKIIIKP